MMWWAYCCGLCVPPGVNIMPPGPGPVPMTPRYPLLSMVGDVCCIWLGECHDAVVVGEGMGVVSNLTWVWTPGACMLAAAICCCMDI